MNFFVQSAPILLVALFFCVNVYVSLLFVYAIFSNLDI
jgi:hypothetical protein